MAAPSCSSCWFLFSPQWQHQCAQGSSCRWNDCLQLYGFMLSVVQQPLDFPSLPHTLSLNSHLLQLSLCSPDAWKSLKWLEKIPTRTPDPTSPLTQFLRHSDSSSCSSQKLWSHYWLLSFSYKQSDHVIHNINWNCPRQVRMHGLSINPHPVHQQTQSARF